MKYLFGLFFALGMLFTSCSSEDGDFHSIINPNDKLNCNIEQCDHRLTATGINCYRSGDNVVFNFLLENNGLGTVNNFYIATGKSGGVNSLFPTIIHDDLQNSYSWCSYITFGKYSTHYISGPVLDCPFYSHEVVKCKIEVCNVDRNAKYLDIELGVLVYDWLGWGYDRLENGQIIFHNVQIR